MSGYIGPIPVPQGVQDKQSFTATASQTTFTTRGYTDGAFINVYLNGVRLINGTDYTATNGSDIVLTTGASASDVLDFETINEVQLVSNTSTTPIFKTSATLKNDTHEDTDGGRESTLIFSGEQSGGEISTLAEIEASHDGTSDDQKGDLIFRTNDGSDGTSPTERMRIDSVGTMTVTATDQSVAVMQHSSSSTAALNGGAIFNIKNTDTTNGNQSSIIFRDSGDNSTSGIFAFNTDHSDGEGFMKFGTRDSGGTFGERMRITSGGFVGINTATPDFNGFGAGSGILAIASDTGSAKTAMINLIGDGNDTDATRVASLFYNDASATGAGATLAGVEAYRASTHATDPGADLTFSTNSSGGSYTEKMRIEAGGNVGIGTNSPTAALDVRSKIHVEADTPGAITGFAGQLEMKATGVGSDIGILMRTAQNSRGIFVDDSDSNTMRFYGGAGAGTSYDVTISNLGNVVVPGSLSKGSGSFKIKHPLEAKKDTHWLVHSFVEGPQADNLYRGKVNLVDGTATQNIDTVAGMSEGTFAALNREVQCFTTNETGWTAVKGSVSGNILTITAQDDTCTDTISWMVIGERKDEHMMSKHTTWTDSDGKVIIEPELTDKEKSEITDYDPDETGD